VFELGVGFWLAGGGVYLFEGNFIARRAASRLLLVVEPTPWSFQFGRIFRNFSIYFYFYAAYIIL